MNEAGTRLTSEKEGKRTVKRRRSEGGKLKDEGEGGLPSSGLRFGADELAAIHTRAVP